MSELGTSTGTVANETHLKLSMTTQTHQFPETLTRGHHRSSVHRTVCFSSGTVVPPEVTSTTRRLAEACCSMNCRASSLCASSSFGAGLVEKYWSSDIRASDCKAMLAILYEYLYYPEKMQIRRGLSWRVDWLGWYNLMGNVDLGSDQCSISEHIFNR